TGVDLARMKSEYLHQYRLRHGTKARSRLLAHVHELAAWGSRFASASNWLGGTWSARWLLDVLFSLDRRRTLPRYSRQTFLDWWHAQLGRYESGPAKSNQQVALFADTFTNFHEPEIPIAVAKLASAASWSVTVPPQVCCGRPLISKG